MKMADGSKAFWNRFAFQDIVALTGTYSTPFYLYDFDAVSERVRRMKESLGSGIRLYYAVKANPNPSLLEFIRPLVDGVDVSSGGELECVLETGFAPEAISFAGPGKTDEELRLAVNRGIGSISVESLKELRRVGAIASEAKRTATISLRVNPVKAIKAFKIKMGGKSSQFGIDEELGHECFDMLKRLNSVRLRGIHVYSGTQCLSSDALIENIQQTLGIVRRFVKTEGMKPEVVNFGGGFGIPYHEDQKSLESESVCSTLSEVFSAFCREMKLEKANGILELGRFLVAEAGIYVSRVVDIKHSRGRLYGILDGGMHHHLPASGNFGQVIRKNFRIVNLSNEDTEPVQQITLVGPLCTSIDVMGDRVFLPETRIGDCIGILNSGAYGYTASPLLFLSHRTPLELAAEGDQIRIIRESG